MGVMKKKKGVRKKKISKKKFDDKRLLAIVIATFIVFAFALNFVHVGEMGVTGYATEGFISNMFADWSTGNMDVNIAKYLLWIMVTLLIFSVLNYAKFPGNTGLQWLLAIPIGFLSVAYITPAEIFTTLTAYSALGLTLAVIMPFVILLFFSSMLLSNEKISKMSVGKIMFEVMLWLFFVGFLIYKLIAGYGEGIKMSSGMMIVMFIVMGLSGMILVFNKNFRKWVRGLGLELRSAKAEVQREERKQEKEAGREAE